MVSLLQVHALVVELHFHRDGAFTLAAKQHCNCSTNQFCDSVSPVKSAGQFAIVLVTAPDVKVARRLARAALQAKLIACANLVPGLESHYWWRGRLDTSAEVLLILKTRRDKIAALEKLILAQHPYDTPEILVVPLREGTPRYLKWLADSMS